MDVSTWAAGQFGTEAALVRIRVQRALGSAQEDAVAAHAASGSRKRVTYGHTMAVRQHEQMLKQFADYPNVEVFHPAGASYDLVRIGADGPILLPWRFATDSTTSHEQARMKPSRVRYGLLAGDDDTDQLTFEHAELSEEELQEHFAQLQMLSEELRRWHRLVTIGYSSNLDGLYRLGWGELELHADGGVLWRYWEPMPLPGAAGYGDGTSASTTTIPARLSSLAEPAAQRPRFDDAPLDDDLGLTARTPTVSDPQQEAPADVAETGTEDGQS